MLSSDKNPFTDSLLTLATAAGVAMLGGLVRYVNHTEGFKLWVLIRDLLTAAFCGICTYWACEWMSIVGPLSAIMIATSGLMGTRLIRVLEEMYLIRMGMKATTPIETALDNDRDSHESHPDGKSKEGV
jgi:LydA holin phage, holin superfamily III